MNTTEICDALLKAHRLELEALDRALATIARSQGVNPGEFPRADRRGANTEETETE